MTDPYVALVSFQQALDSRQIEVLSGQVHSELLVHFDAPVDQPRMSYAVVEDDLVKALVMFVEDQPIRGVKCYGVGYAVLKQFQRQGIATKVLRKSIDELRFGLSEHMAEFYVEAVVGRDNVASQKVASRVLAPTGRPGTDRVSGQPILMYERLFRIADR